MFGNELKSVRKERHLTQKALAEMLNVKQGTIANWESGARSPDAETIAYIAKVLCVSTDRLFNGEIKPAPPEPNAAPANNIRMIPVFDSVSAGFGVGAVDRVTEYTPIAIDSDAEAAETICVRVCGDSMYPKIEDGDMVQVHKQETAETGDIVVILDGSEAFVKRFIRGKNGVVLESLNQAYPPRRYTREESNELRVVGIVKRVIRDI